MSQDNAQPGGHKKPQGVICEIADPKQMPDDVTGAIADAVLFPGRVIPMSNGEVAEPVSAGRSPEGAALNQVNVSPSDKTDWKAVLSAIAERLEDIKLAPRVHAGVQLLAKFADNEGYQEFLVTEPGKKALPQPGDRVTIMYHAKCMDGMVSAYIAERMVRLLCGEDTDIIMIPVQYGSFVPDVDPDNFVFMVDFSYEPRLLSQLAASCKGLTVIDHHLSALLKFAPGAWDGTYSVIISDERIQKHSAALMTAKLFHQCYSDNWIRDEAFYAEQDMLELAEVVSRYDTWQHDGVLDTPENYLKNFFAEVILPQHKLISEACGLDPDSPDNFPNVSTMVGYMLTYWRDARFTVGTGEDSKEFNAALGIGLQIQNRYADQVAALNNPRQVWLSGSDDGLPLVLRVFDEKIESKLIPTLVSPEYMPLNTMAMIKVINANEDGEIVWALRWRPSKDTEDVPAGFNARSVAEHLGGGGHTGAAGFRSDMTVDKLIWTIEKFHQDLVAAESKSPD